MAIVSNLKQSPQYDASVLYIHNYLTSYYLRNRTFTNTEGKIILDVGCETGEKAFILAEANPGAKIIGIDRSETAISIAKQRLQQSEYNTDFYVLSLENLSQLGLTFDYINADKILSLLPEPTLGLQILQSVLKPEGIIRANLPHAIARFEAYRARQFFGKMGLLNQQPDESAINAIKTTMKALKDEIILKQAMWRPVQDTDAGKDLILESYLFEGNRGYKIPEFLSMLEAANLEFISLVNWQQWNLQDLFQDISELPIFLAMTLAEMSLEEQLHLFELLHPVHPQIDLWCGHPHQGHTEVSIAEWTITDWETARVYLHPQLRTQAVIEDLIRCVTQLQPFDISQHLAIAQQSVKINSTMAACLYPLLEAPQSVQVVVARLQQLMPVHPLTLQPVTQAEAFAAIRQVLTQLEGLGYVLLERYPES